MRQYEQGKRFCDAVVAERGHRGPEPRLGLARGAAHAGASWRGRPSWLARVRLPPAAAAA